MQFATYELNMLFNDLLPYLSFATIYEARNKHMNYSEKIYELRRRENISQEALAASVGTTRQQVSRWECGSAVPNPKYSYALAAYFGCTVEELYGEKVEEDQKEKEDVIKDKSGFHFGNASLFISISSIISYILSVVLVGICVRAVNYAKSMYILTENSEGGTDRINIRNDYSKFLENVSFAVKIWVIASLALCLITLIILFARYISKSKNKIARSDLFDPFIAALTFVIGSLVAGIIFTSFPPYEERSIGYIIGYAAVIYLVSLHLSDVLITLIRMPLRPLLKKAFVLTPWKGTIRTTEIVYVSLAVTFLLAIVIYVAVTFPYTIFTFLNIVPIILLIGYFLFAGVSLLVHFLYCYSPFGREEKKI